MNTSKKFVGAIASISLLLTVIWLVLLIYGMTTQGPVKTYEQALASVADLDLLHCLTYANATLITLAATTLFAGLYVYCRPQDPIWPVVGLTFVPVYTVLNLFAYLSQITIVPRLVTLQPEADLLLAQMVQSWPGSAVNVVNNLGYAVLGIPSIIFGVLLGKRDTALRLAGILLALSGVASIAGMLGLAVKSTLLGLGSIAGGVVFLAALIPLSVTSLRKT